MSTCVHATGKMRSYGHMASDCESSTASVV